MLLEWGRPPQKEDPEVRAEYWGGGIPGAYAPNMDADWMARWKAKMTGQRGAVLGVEIRKTVRIRTGSSVQVLIRVGEDGGVVMSMNGTAGFTPKEFAEMFQAVAEARAAMAGWRASHPLGKQAPS